MKPLSAQIVTNILGINTSPRTQGNTACIIDTILEGARQQGAQTRTLHVAELDISPCRGCWACHRGEGGCVLPDDMPLVNEAIDRANVIIFGSPIYMTQMTAQAKIVVDRLFARFSPRYSPYFKEESAAQKRLVLTFNQGNPDPGLFQPYIDYTRRMFELLEFEVQEVPVVTGLRNSPASDREELRAALREFGGELVRRHEN